MHFILKKLSKLSSRVLQVIALFILVFGFLQPVSVHAQGVAGFAECDFTAARVSTGSGAGKFQSCIRQVLTFVFVIGLFVIAFRIALAAFTNINPSSDSKAVAQSITSISDILIGLIFIGAPAIILGTLNPALLNLSFLDFGRLGTGTQSNIASVGLSTSGSNGTASSSGSQSAVKTLLDKLTKNVADCNAGTESACAELRKYASDLESCQLDNLLFGDVITGPTDPNCILLDDSAISTLLDKYGSGSGLVEGSWIFANNTNFQLKQNTYILPSALSSIGNNTFYVRLGPENPTSASQSVTIRLSGSSCVADNAPIFANGDVRKDKPLLAAGGTFKTSATCQISVV